MDYRKILKEYMNGVGMAEGIDFIDMMPSGVLTLEEESELYRIRLEIEEDYERKKAEIVEEPIDSYRDDGVIL